MKDKFSYGLIIFIAFICGGLTMYYFSNSKVYVTSNQSNNNSTIVEKVYKDLDNKHNSNLNLDSNASILSSAINKVYDSTVMINNYKDDKISNTGSGFIYKVDDKYGYVMTNHHVIDNSKKIVLVLTDDSEIEAKVLGSDQYLDLAVLRFDKKYVKTVVTIGKNSECKLGDEVFTIGSPLGYEYRGTVTNGIISGFNRLVEVSVSGNGDDWVMEVIQTNTAVNPGNSGGPLFNTNGEVIGVISLKLVEDSVEGMGFAIPIADAMSHIEKLEKGQEIERPLLGISMVNASNKTILKKYYNIDLKDDINNGVVVIEISDGTGASKSSLKKGDVITKIDGKNVDNLAYLKYLLYKHNVGDTVELTYYRDGKYNTTKVNLIKNNQ